MQGGPMTLLSDRVHHELKRRLTLWEYLPGTRMGEEALAAEFGVSRTPVRDALRRLVQEGFLEDTEGWTGYRVRKPDLPRIEELYEVRLSLEQTAVRRLAKAPADPEIDELLKVWQQPKGPRPAPSRASLPATPNRGPRSRHRPPPERSGHERPCHGDPPHPIRDAPALGGGPHVPFRRGRRQRQCELSGPGRRDPRSPR